MSPSVAQQQENSNQLLPLPIASPSVAQPRYTSRRVSCSRQIPMSSRTPSEIVRTLLVAVVVTGRPVAVKRILRDYDWSERDLRDAIEMSIVHQEQEVYYLLEQHLERYYSQLL